MGRALELLGMRGFSSPGMVRAYFDSTAESVPPRRKRRRKPSSVAPVIHLSGLIVACAAVLALFR